MTGVQTCALPLSFHKGVIWILVATIAEVPPVVSLASFSISPFRSSLSYILGLHCFELEW